MMDTKENAEKTVDQPLTAAEYYTQLTHDKGASENQFSQQIVSRKDNQAKMPNPGAVRMAGFLFWVNFAGVLLLLVGFVAPGWLTAKTDQKLYYPEYSYHSVPRHLYKVYQDYALWYVTQCYEHDGTNIVCETMTYRTIDNVYEDDDFEKIEIGKMEMVGDDDRFMFHGAGLAFGFQAIVRVQLLYTMGLLIALFTVYKWYQFRANVAHDKSISLSKLKWALLLLLTVLSAVLVLVPVFVFILVRGDIGEDDYRAKIDTPFGSVFAGFGGGMMALVAVTVFMQIVCCRNTDAYICSCTDESDVSITMVED